MKRFAAVLLILCLLFSACGGSDSDELIVEVQRDVTIPVATEFPSEVPTAANTEPATIPEITAPTAAATEPNTIPTTEATEPPTEPPTQASTEPPTEAPAEEPEEASSPAQDYVLNKSSKKFHYPHCGSVKQMKEKNRKDFYGPREEVLSMDYVPCKNCKP